MNILIKGTLGYLALMLSTHAGQLINVDYTAHLNPTFSVKTGTAAIGFTPTDYWNVSSRDGANMFDWLADNAVADMKWSDGATSTADLQVNNAAGAWFTFSPDAMMQSYLYPFANAPISSQISELPAGTYDFYVYAHGQPGYENGVVQLLKGAADYGTLSTTTDDTWDTEPWTEGVQYVHFGGVVVAPGDIVTILSLAGSRGLPVINGLQIYMNDPATTPVPEAGTWAAAGLLTVALAGSIRRKSKKLV